LAEYRKINIIYNSRLTQAFFERMTFDSATTVHLTCNKSPSPYCIATAHVFEQTFEAICM